MRHAVRTRLRQPSIRSASLVAEVAVVGAACAAVMGLSRIPLFGRALSLPADGRVLAPAVTGAAVATFVLGAVASRLAASRLVDDPRSRWIPVALAGYAVALVPSAAMVETPGDQAGSVACLVAAGLLAVVVAVAAYRRRSTPYRRTGLGLVVLAAAHLHRVLDGRQSDDLVFAGLMLVGLVVVAAGLAQLTAHTLSDLRSQLFQQQEELSCAAVAGERAAELAAERNHELRNGLAGLAGITHLLGSRRDRTDHAQLRHAVLAELGRLHTILHGGVPDEGDTDGAGAVDYPVEPVLVGLVTLRRSAGCPVELAVEPGLHARGHSPVLAQVVMNLLVNCERHAQGTRVTVHAHRSGDAVVVDVRDEGPGLPACGAPALPRRGVRDPMGGGAGLGLHISRRLIERERGTLCLRTGEDPRGCIATVTVPAAVSDVSANR